MRIFLTGVSCVGTTTIGEKLGELLGVRFFDLDKEIESFFGTSIERLRGRYLTIHTFRKEAAKALVHLLNRPESRDCVITLPPGGLMGGYLRAIKKANGITAVVTDKPENILERIRFYDIDSRLIEKKLTPKEKKLQLREIKKDITYFRKSHERANLWVDISGLDPDQAARKVKEAVEDLEGKVGQEAKSEEEMRAVCITPERGVELKRVLVPGKAEPGYLVIKMLACAINSGDKFWIAGGFPPGFAPESLHGICGVSGAGKVIEIGDGVPEEYRGKSVAVYRSLKASDHMVGTWCEYAHMHYLHCVILPEDVNLEEYSGSLVNTITPYAFLKQITEEGHEGVICTAGTSATGRAMLGICLANDVPVISIVRNKGSREHLKELNAPNVLVQGDSDFDTQLGKLSNRLKTTAVFDGVGGELLGRVAKVLPRGSFIYAYGFLGGEEQLCIHTSTVLMNNLTITGFGNFTSKTVQDPRRLEEALRDLSGIIDMPHFKTKVGDVFRLEEINAALRFSSGSGSKAVLCPFR